MNACRFVARLGLFVSVAFSAAIFSAASTRAVAQAPADQPPTYMRMRQGADDWHARGGGYGYSWPSSMYGGYYLPYAPFYPPVVVGSWYQRPYPYHFDYARQRWGGPLPMAPAVGGAPNDCPCDQPEAALLPAPVSNGY